MNIGNTGLGIFLNVTTTKRVFINFRNIYHIYTNSQDNSDKHGTVKHNVPIYTKYLCIVHDFAVMWSNCGSIYDPVSKRKN